MTIQKNIENKATQLVRKYGVEKAVDIIKNSEPGGIFANTQNYPNGVFIECCSEKGGVLVGTRI
jgi:hypothetical protein